MISASSYCVCVHLLASFSSHLTSYNSHESLPCLFVLFAFLFYPEVGFLFLFKALLFTVGNLRFSVFGSKGVKYKYQHVFKKYSDFQPCLYLCF